MLVAFATSQNIGKNLCKQMILAPRSIFHKFIFGLKYVAKAQTAALEYKNLL